MSERGSPISVWVPGDPKSWPRPIPILKRMGGAARCTNKRGCRVKVIPGATDKVWRRAIKLRVAMIVGRNKPWFQDGEPLVLGARFCLERPKAHFIANDRSRPLKANAPTPGSCTVKKDVDNLSKAVADALQEESLVYEDDKDVTLLLARKMWASPGKGCGMDLLLCRVADISGDPFAWLMAE